MIVGIETARGPWVAALSAAGYRGFAINPLSTARYRQRHSTSGAKSDAADAHFLAEIVRLDRDRRRQVAGDTDLADAREAVGPGASNRDLGTDPPRTADEIRAAGRAC